MAQPTCKFRIDEALTSGDCDLFIRDKNSVPGKYGNLYETSEKLFELVKLTKLHSHVVIMFTSTVTEAVS